MAIKIITSHLIDTLKDCKKVIDSRPSLPVLGSLLCEYTHDILTVSGTNLTTGIQREVPIKSECEGSFLLPFDAAYKVIPTLFDPQSRLDITFENNVVTFTQSANTWSIPEPYDTNMFPVMPEGTTLATVKGKEFKSAITYATLAAITTDTERRPILSTLKVTQDSVAGCDGYRLHKVNITCEGEPFTVHPKAKELNTLVKLLSDDPITLLLSDTSVGLQQGSKTLWIENYMDHKYPKFESIIPSHQDFTFTVYRDDLLDATNVCKKLSKEVAYHTTLDFEPDEMILNVCTPESGDLSKRVSINGVCETTYALNVSFLQDALKDTEDNVTVALSSPVEPFTITSNEKFALLMPMS